jgi:hypothetical protein
MKIEVTNPYSYTPDVFEDAASVSINGEDSSRNGVLTINDAQDRPLAVFASGAWSKAVYIYDAEPPAEEPPAEEPPAEEPPADPQPEPEQ